MYKLLLSWRYLRTRYIALASIVSVTLGVATMIVVNSVMHGFTTEMRNRIHGILSDVVFESRTIDGFRDARGPDDAPHVALSSAGELAGLFARIVNAGVVAPAVSAQVGEWLNLNQDLALVGSSTALDPFGHEDDRHGLLFVNKTGRADGIRAEAGVLAGPHGGVAYALIVCFDDLSIAHRLRAHDAFRALGADLM